MGAMRNYGQTKFLQVPSYPQRLDAIHSHLAPRHSMQLTLAYHWLGRRRGRWICKSRWAGGWMLSCTTLSAPPFPSPSRLFAAELVVCQGPVHTQLGVSRNPACHPATQLWLRISKCWALGTGGARTQGSLPGEPAIVLVLRSCMNDG